MEANMTVKPIFHDNMILLLIIGYVHQRVDEGDEVNNSQIHNTLKRSSLVVVCLFV